MLVVNTDSFSADSRRLLLFFLDAFFELPTPDRSYDDVVREFENNTVIHACHFGIGPPTPFSAGTFGQLISFYLRVERQKYAKVIQLFAESFFRIQFDIERLLVIVKKLLNAIPDMKRSGDRMAQEMCKKMLFTAEGSNVRASSVLSQASVLQEVLSKLETNPQSVIDGLQNLRTQGCFSTAFNRINNLRLLVTHPSNMMLSISADYEALKQAYQDPVDPLHRFFAKSMNQSTVRTSAFPVKMSQSFLTRFGAAQRSAVC